MWGPAEGWGRRHRGAHAAHDHLTQAHNLFHSPQTLASQPSAFLMEGVLIICGHLETGLHCYHKAFLCP